MAHNVLHILDTAGHENTAIARIVGGLAAGLSPRGYQVHAWFLGSHGPLEDELQQAGAQVRVLAWPNLRNTRALWRFWRELAGGDFALIHQHVGGRTLRWLRRVGTCAPVIAHLHGLTDEGGGPTPAEVLCPGASAVIAVSRAVANTVSGAHARVIYPGVAIPEPAAEPDKNPPVIGTARRLVAVKGLSFLLRAFSLLRDAVPDARLKIAGAGPEQAALETEAQKLGLGKTILFLGWQKDLTPLLRRCRVFALPSVEEAFGVAALEAMAMGLPVVGTSVGGIPEIIEDGQSGWIVPPSDPEALAGRLRDLLLHPDRCAVMGRAGRLRVEEKFSVQRMVDQVASLYDRLLESA